MFTPGPVQIIFLLLVVLLLFGKRIPETMKSLGVGAREFKKGLEGVDEQEEKEDEKKKEEVEAE